jgi:hypothetical protein
MFLRKKARPQLNLEKNRFARRITTPEMDNLVKTTSTHGSAAQREEGKYSRRRQSLLREGGEQLVRGSRSPSSSPKARPERQKDPEYTSLHFTRWVYDNFPAHFRIGHISGHLAWRNTDLFPITQ